MGRTSHGVHTHDFAFEHLRASAAAAPTGAAAYVPPLPDRLRRRRTSPRYLMFRLRISWRRRRLNGDAALLVLCVLLFAATIAGAVSLVSLAR